MPERPEAAASLACPPMPDEALNAPAIHPDPEIAAEIQADALAAEMADLAAGYPPRRWTCPCGASHSRGLQPNGGHRCLACGYIGTGGTLADAQGASDV